MRLLPFALSLCIGTAVAADPAAPATTPTFDAALAQRTGADERGMRRYVLVILKTGPTRVPDGEARDAMFAGHMANIGRMAKDGTLALAGPFIQDPAAGRHRPGDRAGRDGRRIPPLVRLGGEHAGAGMA